jgi:hypothetical protein
MDNSECDDNGCLMLIQRVAVFPSAPVSGSFMPTFDDFARTPSIRRTQTNFDTGAQMDLP